MTDNEYILSWQKADKELFETVTNYRMMFNELLGRYKRQKAEIKHLNEDIVIQMGLINHQKAEIDRYKINLPHLEQQDEDFCGVLCDFAEELIGKAKSEAIKEFAERLKIFVIPQKADGYTREIVLKSNIDNLVKEMTEAK